MLSCSSMWFSALALASHTQLPLTEEEVECGVDTEVNVHSRLDPQRDLGT